MIPMTWIFAPIAGLIAGVGTLALLWPARDQPPKASLPTPQKWAILCLVPLISLGLYWVIGSPHYPDQPWASRGMSIEPLLEAEKSLLQERPLLKELRADPQNAAAWYQLAKIYMGAGRLSEACQALRDGIDETNAPPLRTFYDTIKSQIAAAPMLTDATRPDCP